MMFSWLKPTMLKIKTGKNNIVKNDILNEILTKNSCIKQNKNKPQITFKIIVE